MEMLILLLNGAHWCSLNEKETACDIPCHWTYVFNMLLVSEMKHIGRQMDMPSPLHNHFTHFCKECIKSCLMFHMMLALPIISVFRLKGSGR